MIRKLLFIISIVIFISCSQKQQVDLLVTNANIYTVNKSFDQAEAFVVKDGKIVEVGTEKHLQKKYQATETYHAQGKTILPGLIDGHAHFYGLGLNQQVVDLVGTKSFDEVISRVVDFQQQHQKVFIEGRGWNQNLWENKEFPTKEKLDSLFPDIPVALTRIDGHAYLVNQKALDMAGITAQTQIEGGEVIIKNGKPTGILIDNPMLLVDAIKPKTTTQESVKALQDAQQICFSYGLTTINDAGLDKEIIRLIDSLQQANQLDIRLYAMISNTPENVDYYLEKGIIKTEKLHVRSVKVYGDGALGSRGACLKDSYSDQHNHFGALVTSVEDLKNLAQKLAQTDFQMNTHAIGDSTNAVVLKTYTEVLKGQTNRRWKVEHAQVVSQEDFSFFENKNIIPSVQSTHATSDMYWAEDRVGAERIKGAYAYKNLLEKAGIIVLGTDFPVEHVSPFYTFYASVARKDLNQFPEGGFQPENALSRKETLMGMTIWAAYSNFEENEKGSIEVGKYADFIIIDKDIMTVNENEIPNIQVEATFLGGKKVYQK